MLFMSSKDQLAPGHHISSINRMYKLFLDDRCTLWVIKDDFSILWKHTLGKKHKYRCHLSIYKGVVYHTNDEKRYPLLSANDPNLLYYNLVVTDTGTLELFGVRMAWQSDF
eukprot:TRINITY_DN26079_c0_g1_i1.p1 TRINITY_DN26079_c0_g1~~TRINITY_DN26079_c0_g1_i1.p1  ORF type:complete len:111 (-),score=13.58 TRINITY_DN26079_c0_g1_i1:9-341(-)